MKTGMVLGALAGTLAGAMALAAAAQADVADFYKGKQVTLNVGAGEGGGFGLYARILSKHFGKHVPGNPTIVVQHMQGGGGVKAANFMYNVAPQDGSVIHAPVSSIVEDQMLRPKSVRFDGSKFHWIGSTADLPTEFGVWNTAPAQTLDAMKTTQVVIGAPSGYSFLYRMPKLMNELLGTKFKIIIGYKGSRDVDLAMERGEVQGRAVGWSSAVARTAKWYKEGKVKSIVQYGPKPVPELTAAGVPRMIDLVKSPEEKKIVSFLYSFMLIGRAALAPPGVPKDRVAALIAAFEKTQADPEFKAELAKRKLPQNPSTAKEIQDFVNDMVATPKTLVAKISKLVAPPAGTKKK
jgi:tripartite-type tricarboxylate transporter receptor subunit TctC